MYLGICKNSWLFTVHWQFEAIFPAYFLSEKGTKATKPTLFPEYKQFLKPLDKQREGEYSSKYQELRSNVLANTKNSACFGQLQFVQSWKNR